MTKPTTGKYSHKLYRCNDCEFESLHGTNHWGDIYPRCQNCGWKTPTKLYNVHTCLEELPEGYDLPEPWTEASIQVRVVPAKDIDLEDLSAEHYMDEEELINCPDCGDPILPLTDCGRCLEIETRHQLEQEAYLEDLERQRDRTEHDYDLDDLPNPQDIDFQLPGDDEP